MSGWRRRGATTGRRGRGAASPRVPAGLPSGDRLQRQGRALGTGYPSGTTCAFRESEDAPCPPPTSSDMPTASARGRERRSASWSAQRPGAIAPRSCGSPASPRAAMVKTLLKTLSPDSARDDPFGDCIELFGVHRSSPALSGGFSSPMPAPLISAGIVPCLPCVRWNPPLMRRPGRGEWCRSC